MEIITLLMLVLGFSPKGNQDLISFEKLNDSPWKPLHWAGYPFIFLSYGGDWSKLLYKRVAHEFKVQRLLTPTWEDPAFTHPVESSASEWGWAIRPEGETKPQCYEWTKKLYLDRITRRAHSNAPIEEDELFYSLTGHSWFSVYGAQWGCDMIGLETGENIIAMQGEIAFLRGAARQNQKPFYVQPSQWYGGTVPIYEEGEDEYTPHELDEAKVIEGIRSGGIAITNGGHSPSLLARMWYVAWLSGAAIVCPEACQSIFFAGDAEKNWNKPMDERIPLSPIGKRAKEFMRIVTQHNNIGIPYTPFAIMLDEFCGFNGFPLTQPRPWNVLEPSLGEREISLFLDTIFPRSMYLDFIPGVDVEREDRRLVNSPYGDTFDVLLSNVPESILNSYPVVFCLGEHEFLTETVDKLISYAKSGGKLFLTHSHAQQLGDGYCELQKTGNVELFGLDQEHLPDKIEISRWCTPEHWGASEATLKARKKAVELLPYEIYFKESVSQIMDKLSKEYLPIEVSGEIEFTVNRLEKGWLIGLINNDGVTKGNMTPVKLDPSKKRRVTICLKLGNVVSASELFLDEELDVMENAVTIEVPPGEIRILELACSK